MRNQEAEKLEGATMRSNLTLTNVAPSTIYDPTDIVMLSKSRRKDMVERIQQAS